MNSALTICCMNCVGLTNNHVDQPLAGPRPSNLAEVLFATGHGSRLNAIVDEANLVECEEEGRIAYITTWFIHHETFQECREARPVRLAGSSETGRMRFWRFGPT